MNLGDVMAAGWTREAYARYLAYTYGEALRSGSLPTMAAWRRHGGIMASLFGGEAHEYCDAAEAAWQREHGAAHSPAIIPPGVIQHAAE